MHARFADIAKRVFGHTSIVILVLFHFATCQVSYGWRAFKYGRLRLAQSPHGELIQRIAHIFVDRRAVRGATQST